MSEVISPGAGRNYAFDYLRIIASFAIVLLHSSAEVFVIRHDAVSLFYDSACRFGVPIFVMISGYLHLSRPLAPGKLYRHIFRLIMVYFSWSLFYGAVTVYSRHAAGEMFSVQGAAVLLFKEFVCGYYHLWFLPMLAGIYFLVPVLEKIVCDRRAAITAVALFIICSIILPTLIEFIPDQRFIRKKLLSFEWTNYWAYAGYFVIGYLLWQNGRKYNKMLAWLLGVGVIFTFAVSWIYTKRSGLAFDGLFSPFRLGSLCMAVGVYALGGLFMTRAPRSSAVGAWLIELSAASLGVYILHPFFILLSKICGWGIPFMEYFPLVTIPFFAIIVYAVSLGIVLLLRLTKLGKLIL